MFKNVNRIKLYVNIELNPAPDLFLIHISLKSNLNVNSKKYVNSNLNRFCKVYRVFLKKK